MLFICFKLIGEMTTILGDGNSVHLNGEVMLSITVMGRVSKKTFVKSWLI